MLLLPSRVEIRIDGRGRGNRIKALREISPEVMIAAGNFASKLFCCLHLLQSNALRRHASCGESTISRNVDNATIEIETSVRSPVIPPPPAARISRKRKANLSS